MEQKKEKKHQDLTINVNSVYAVWGGERSAENFYPNWVYEDAITWTGTENIVSTEKENKSSSTLNMSYSEVSETNNDTYVLQVIEELKVFMGSAEPHASEKTEAVPCAEEKNKVEDTLHAEKEAQLYPFLERNGEFSKIVNGRKVPVSRLDAVVGFELRPHKKEIDIECDDMTEPP